MLLTVLKNNMETSKTSHLFCPVCQKDNQKHTGSVLLLVLPLDTLMTLGHTEVCSSIYGAIITLYDRSWATVQPYAVAHFIYL